MEIKGFVEKAWQTDRTWRDKSGKEHNLFKATIDGETYDFFIQKEILDYINKEVVFEASDGQYGKKGKLATTDGKKPMASGGFRGKSPESILLEVIGKSVNTALMESRAFAIAFLNPKDPKPENAGAIQAIQDTMFDYMVAQATKGIKEMQKGLKGE